MKTVVVVLMMLVFNSLLAETHNKDVAIQEEKNNAFKGLFYKVWNRFKTLSPKKENKIRKVVVTMGIRGAQTTSSILQPYWKDDKTSDEKYMQQLEQFAQAQTLADKSNMANASEAFRRFIKEYPKSDLRPNAQFAEALTLAAMGSAAESSRLFNAFIEEHPGHPLVSDAKFVMQDMGQ